MKPSIDLLCPQPLRDLVRTLELGGKEAENTAALPRLLNTFIAELNKVAASLQKDFLG